MLNPRRCPSCGQTEEKGEFINSFCPKCFTSRNEIGIIPPVLTISKCSVCKRIFHGNEWINPDSKLLGEIAISKARSQYPFSVKRVETVQKNSLVYTLLVTEYTIDEKKLQQKLHTILKLEPMQCIDCSRQHGGFYDAIVQVRQIKEDREENEDWDKMERKTQKLIALLEKMGARAVKVEKTETGFDVKVAGISPALSAARKIALEFTHTRKLIGRKNGKDLYRHTFCARV